MISNFPNITAKVENLTITGVDTFALDTLVYFENFTATLDIMSVISGDEIKVKRIILNKPNIYIKILENGYANYDIAKEDTAATTETDTVNEESAFKVNLDKFEIKNGNITYDDKEGDVFAQLKNLNFLLSGDMSETLTNLKIEMTSDTMTVKSGGIKYLNKVKTAFNSELQADLENSIYTFKENNLKLNEIDLGFDGKVEMPSDDIVLDLTFKTKNTKFKDVLSMIPVIYKTDFEDVETSGNFKMNGYVKGTYNDTNMPAYGVKLLVSNAKFKYPDLPKSVNDININLKLDAKEGSGDDMTIDIKKASLTTAGNPFKMNAFINMTAADIGMSGKVNGKIDLNSVKDVVPLEDMTFSGIITADIGFKGNLSDIENENYEKFDAKGNLGIENMDITMSDMPKIDIQKADMYFSPQFIDLKQFDIKVGKSDFHMKGKVNNIFSYVFKDELLSGTFNLNSDYIDVDELSGTGETSETVSENNSDEESSSSEDASEVVEIPKNLDFILNSNLKNIKYDKMQITNAKGKILVKNGKLDMTDLKMNMLGGEVRINGTYDAKDLSKPTVDFNMSMTKINISELVKTFTSIKTIAPVIENCIGDINADISLNSLLKQDMTPILKSLISNGNLSSDNIRISGNGLLGKLANATKQNKFKSPRVNDLNLKYFIDNGNLFVKPSTFKLAGTQVTLGGKQGLDRKLNLDMDMQLPKRIAGKFISSIPGNNSNENVTVGAKIGGTADNPKISGLSSSLTDIVTDEVREKVEEVKDKAKERANQIIKNAQKQANVIMSQAEKQAANIRSEAKKQGQRLISEAGKQGDKLINQAHNPIAKKAAQISKQELIKNAKKQANNLNVQAGKQANNVINSARTRADKIVSDAKKRAASY
ncbi:MAG: hypothetical protein DRI94_14535 [Bacteroidetes bacterium]|nr:MAG: hypothetical protein DRI94_14535 [Bacteroidota bacterium]